MSFSNDGEATGEQSQCSGKLNNKNIHVHLHRLDHESHRGDAFFIDMVLIEHKEDDSKVLILD
ncbi:MAG: hypothetical protein ACOYCB_08960 [Fastidiosipilaceae bacterium]